MKLVIVRHLTYNYYMATKTERLSLRLTSDQDAVLRRAAEVHGESTNEYVLRHAVEAARSDLADVRVFVTSENQWDELQSALDSAVVLSQGMVALLVAPSILEK